MCAIFLIAFCGIGVAAEGAGARNCDPARNTDDDIQAAQVEARRSGKRILLDVGGEWCPWCRLLNIIHCPICHGMVRTPSAGGMVMRHGVEQALEFASRIP